MEFAACLLSIAVSIFALSFALTSLPYVIRNATRWRLLDIPNDRKIHTIPIPRLGGVGLMPGIFLACSVAILICNNGGANPDRVDLGIVMTGLLIGCVASFLLGLFDDIKHLSALSKLMTQTLIAALCVGFLPTLDTVAGFEVSPMYSALLFFVWLTVVPNAVNLLDGIDGLTGSLGFVFSVVISVMALWMGQPLWLVVTGPFAMACLGFLRFNWRPARIFLGDSGSLTIGFFVAYVSLFFSISNGKSGLSLDLPLAIGLSSIWLLDTSLAILRRYLRAIRETPISSKNPFARLALLVKGTRQVFRPDRDHLHHYLIRVGLSTPGAVAVIVTMWFSLLLVTSALHDSVSFFRSRYFEVSGISLLSLGGFIGLLVAGIMIRRTKIRSLLRLPAPAPIEERDRRAA